MASVTLTDVWIHDATDLTDSVQLATSSLSAGPSKRVQARRYANGNIRRVSRPGVERTVRVQCRFLSRANLTWLDGKVGELVMLRGPRGRKLWGFFAELPTDEYIWTQEGAVTLQFAAVTYDETV